MNGKTTVEKLDYVSKTSELWLVFHTFNGSATVFFKCLLSLLKYFAGSISTSWWHPGLERSLQSLENIFPLHYLNLQNTLTAGQGPIPTRPAIIPHDAREGWVALEHIACFTVESHCRAQFVVTAQPRAVHHIAWVEAWLPELSFMRGEEEKKMTGMKLRNTKNG